MKKNPPLPRQAALTGGFRLPQWLMHTVVWALLFCFPFFFSGRNAQSVGWSDYLRFIIMLLGIVAVFYANYYYLVRRFLFTRQTGWYLLNNFLLFTLLVVLVSLLMEQIPPPQGRGRGGPRPDEGQIRALFVFFDYVKYLFVAALSVAFRMTESWYKMEAERAELDKSRTEAELQNLKSQLNPHFLFNTLNNIYSLVAISPPQAQEAVHDLSRLLRYVLYDSSRARVTVEKDFDFLHNYIELMRIRLPRHVALQTTLQTASPHTLIAPLLFITLVENAFKHGVSADKPSFIHIEITADSRQIACRIRNSYFPKDPQAAQDPARPGLGLSNLRQRLNLLYPGQYTFAAAPSADVYTSDLILKLPGELKIEN
jgi:sensor histidine kinase YesM